MNNKEIEEMAQDIKKTEEDVYRAVMAETQTFVKTHHKYNSKVDYSLAHSKTVYELTAEGMVKLGYQKVNEDSVVLKDYEYLKLCRLAGDTQMEVQKARKETAEKIYRMADEICTGSQNDGDKILAMIKDNFGVEIKGKA
ncbi:MAG: hypothetical protein IKW45_06585 [Clostridia bacterium]|nr:hypothetical protein [Clostridia bacterium]